MKNTTAKTKTMFIITEVLMETHESDGTPRIYPTTRVFDNKEKRDKVFNSLIRKITKEAKAADAEISLNILGHPGMKSDCFRAYAIGFNHTMSWEVTRDEVEVNPRETLVLTCEEF